MADEQSDRRRNFISKLATLSSLCLALSLTIKIILASSPPYVAPNIIPADELRYGPYERIAVVLAWYSHASTSPHVTKFDVQDDATSAHITVHWRFAPGTPADEIKQVLQDTAAKLTTIEGWQHFNQPTSISMTVHPDVEAEADQSDAPICKFDWQSDPAQAGVYVDLRGAGSRSEDQ